MNCFSSLCFEKDHAMKACNYFIARVLARATISCKRVSKMEYNNGCTCDNSPPWQSKIIPSCGQDSQTAASMSTYRLSSGTTRHM